ncbi:uncharacterized protein FIBRA_08675 [Fibroporia radiculosa]|uniref:NADAR domain-containing protein n=1 Tax=Fibroporia radiculosa TaxID=599839 RepID=J4H5A8_9APHY|nr:uncharacterized protein FIBRA_08675 [Fibroporia radiculosa]CCM06414.1 predicted protein [Fibroporia radiculosa]
MPLPFNAWSSSSKGTRFPTPVLGGSTSGSMSESPKEAMIAVMGEQECMKSAFVQLCTESAFSSDMNESESDAGSCTIVQTSVSRQQVTLVILPKLNSGKNPHSDVQSFKTIANTVTQLYKDNRRLNGMVYISNATTEIRKRDVSLFELLCGKDFMQNVILVSVGWGLGIGKKSTLGERTTESTWPQFKNIMDNGGQEIRLHNTSSSARDILKRLIRKQPRTLQIQRELVDDQKNIWQTVMGAALKRELEELSKMYADVYMQAQGESPQSSEDMKKMQMQMGSRQSNREIRQLADINMSIEDVTANTMRMGVGSQQLIHQAQRPLEIKTYSDATSRAPDLMQVEHTQVTRQAERSADIEMAVVDASARNSRAQFTRPAAQSMDIKILGGDDESRGSRRRKSDSEHEYPESKRLQLVKNEDDTWGSRSASSEPAGRKHLSVASRVNHPVAPTPTNTPQSTQMPSTPSPIWFYHKHDPYYGFTNFSPHPVDYNGKSYPTSEHLFQSFKFMEHRPLLAEHIRTCSDRPSVAFSEARRFNNEVRSDWIQVNIQKMEETLKLKFTQHAKLQAELLETGEADLIEANAFWGIGKDKKGENQLGKALVRLRTQLRKELHIAHP